jgi:tetratricopeptide (TPR) repeat protein
MPEDAHSDGKVKIRPRLLQKAAEPEPEDIDLELELEPEPEPASRIETLLKRRLKQTGAKFPARNVSSASSDPEAPEAAGTKPPPGSDKSVARPPATLPERKLDKAPLDDSTENEALEAPDGPIDPLPAAGRKRKREKRGILEYRLSLLPALVLAVVVAGAALTFGVLAGIRLGNKEALAKVARERVEVRPEFGGLLDRGLAKLREGDSESAVKMLAELEKENPGVGSITYLHALALMQNGDTEKAERKADESIAKGERVSDSLALKAVMATMRASDNNVKLMGDPKVRSEQFLRQSMIADTANPFPMIELATLMRYKGKTDEALALLKGARSRLNPVDSHTVVDVSLMLMKLQQTPDAELPRNLPAAGDLASGFGAAYVAMRTGDFAKAAAILTTCRERTAPDLFDYLVNDPAFRRYVSEPALAKFYQ